MKQTAIDIEAAPMTDTPQFDQPDQWECFAIALSHRPTPDAMPETTVLVRRDGTERARRQLLCAMANQIVDWSPDCLVGYNTESFDLPILGHHIGAIAESDPTLAAFVKDALDIEHRDLFAEIVESQPEQQKWPSLSESLRERGLAKATPRLDGSDVTGADMPDFGDKILAGDGLSHRERRVLREYASSDVRPLHPLADRLDRERHAAAEAREATR